MDPSSLNSAPWVGIQGGKRMKLIPQALLPNPQNSTSNPSQIVRLPNSQPPQHQQFGPRLQNPPNIKIIRLPLHQLQSLRLPTSTPLQIRQQSSTSSSLSSLSNQLENVDPSPFGQSNPETTEPEGDVPPPANVKVEEKFYWPEKSASMMLDIYAKLKQKPEYKASRQDKKLWTAVAEELNKVNPPLWSQPIKMSQVKDKFTNTKGTLAKKQDHNRQSGNEPKILTPLEEQLADIKKKLKGEATSADVAEKEDSLNTALFPEDEDEDFVVSSPKPSSSVKTLFSQQTPVSSKIRFKPKTKHGSGSKIAQTKLQLETSFLEFMNSNKASDAVKNSLMEQHLQLMKQSVMAKQKSNELKQIYMTNKTLIHQQKEARFKKMHELKVRELDIRQRELELQERQNASTIFSTQSFNNVLGISANGD